MSVIDQYLRPSAKPHIWCPGCGNGTVLAALLRAINKLGYAQKDVVVVSGIGCCSRGSGFIKFNTVNSLHGRPLPYATGIKFADPDLHVFVIAGDGDTTAIGGNHFIHACRRNIDITMIVVNNEIYGMTGGQYSPTTPTGSFTASSVYGNVERPFDICRLAQAAGATYVARGTAYQTNQLTDLIVEGAKNKGFSVIEAVAQCPTSYGRRNGMKKPAVMLEWQRDHAVPVAAAASMSEEELKDKFLVGTLYQAEKPEYTEIYQKLIDSLKKEG